jgi:hypothetical protein
VLSHHRASVDAHVDATAHLLQAKRERLVNRGIDEIGLAAITTEGDETRLSGLVKPRRLGGMNTIHTLAAAQCSDPRPTLYAYLRGAKA